MTQHFASVDDYIASFPAQTQQRLEEVRRLVASAVPDGEETIAYNMPTITVDGRSVVHFAGWAKHLSIYPEPGGDPELTRDLAPYSGGKGTLRFPLDEPHPRRAHHAGGAASGGTHRLALARDAGPGEPVVEVLEPPQQGRHELVADSGVEPGVAQADDDQRADGQQ